MSFDHHRDRKYYNHYAHHEHPLSLGFPGNRGRDGRKNVLKLSTGIEPGISRLSHRKQHQRFINVRLKSSTCLLDSANQQSHRIVALGLAYFGSNPIMRTSNNPPIAKFLRLLLRLCSRDHRPVNFLRITDGAKPKIREMLHW